jgi:hypothetical protein
LDTGNKIDKDFPFPNKSINIMQEHTMTLADTCGNSSASPFFSLFSCNSHPATNKHFRNLRAHSKEKMLMQAKVCSQGNTDLGRSLLHLLFTLRLAVLLTPQSNDN